MIYIVLLLALGIRLVNLSQSLWLDEAILAQIVKKLTFSELFTQYFPTDFNPPLLYLIEFLSSKVFGYSEIALRLPSVIFGVLTIWLTYKISAKLISKKYSIFPPLLLATSGLHTYYSQEARMYSLATLGVVGSMWAISNLLKTKKHLVSYFFFTLIAVYTHYLTWFMIPAQLVYVFKTKSIKIKKFILLNLAIMLCYLPWIPTFLTQLNLGSKVSSSTWGSVIGGADLKNLALVPIKFLIGRVTLDNKTLYLSLLVIPLTLLTLLIYKARKSLLLTSWFFIPLILIITISIKIPVLSYFRLLFLLPAFYLLIVQGALKLPKKLHLPIIYTFLLVNLISTSTYLFNYRFHRENWKGLVEVLVKNNPTSQPVAIISAVKAPLEYYYSGETIDFVNLEELKNHQQLWVIPYAQPIFYPNLDHHQALTSSGFRETFKQHFRGNLTLVKYTK